MEKHYHWLGVSGGYGVGYGAPASIGAALANRDLGRFSVNIQADGDLMYAPGVLWTAARHKIPMLAVMHNNRGYHQEVMHVQRLSNFRNRVAYLGNDLAPLGTSIQNPDIEYHKLAESMGWWAKGPIKDPAQLAPALKEAVAVTDKQPTAQTRMFVLLHVGEGQTKAGDRQGARETFRRAHPVEQPGHRMDLEARAEIVEPAAKRQKG